MINKLMTEINQKIETLNKLLEDEEYFRNLEIVIDRQNKYNQELAKKLQQKENIIKEVKEYIEEKINTAEQQFVSIPNKLVDIEVLNKLLEILDKGE